MFSDLPIDILFTIEYDRGDTMLDPVRNLKSKSIQPLDAKQINLRESYQVSFWCNYFNCSIQQLEDAVAVTGTSVAAVREFLSK